MGVGGVGGGSGNESRTLRKAMSSTDAYPPKTECGCLHGGVTENGHARNPLTLCSAPLYLHVHVQVWVHIPGDPQSVQLRNDATTTDT